MQPEGITSVGDGGGEVVGADGDAVEQGGHHDDQGRGDDGVIVTEELSILEDGLRQDQGGCQGPSF